MNNTSLARILEITGARSLKEVEEVQSLWSGYGSIRRLTLEGSEIKSLIVKHVRLPDKSHHPRGWNTNLSHQRKVTSYHIECAWYEKYAQHCGMQSRVPKCLLLEESSNEFLMVLEDLDEQGYTLRKETPSLENMQSCLAWLANFHAMFLGQKPEGLWESGTYWHLETRPDELSALEDGDLKEAAEAIDQKLKESPYQTFVHGDAKLANFCFKPDSSEVASVDFQYVGGGCGMKDVAYFIGSCLHEEDCERYESILLDYYFAAFEAALNRIGSEVDAAEVECSWRPLFPVAWTDFHRFVKGWSPGHWKIHSYSERLAKQVIQTLHSNNKVQT